ncbi:MAG: TRAP transporter small permease subunit [Limnobacter sp.]|nr:TRAP transporter small permease subunit [Limnobacter sp.]
MKLLLQFSAAIDKTSDLTGKTVGWLILLMTLICAYNAIVRKVFSVSSNGFLEIQWYLFGAVFLLGSAYALKENAHVRIDVLAGRLSPKAQAWVDIAGFVLFILPLVGFVVIHGYEFVYNSYIVNEYSADPGGLIRWPAKALIVVGFALLGLQVVSELIKKVAQLRGHLELVPSVPKHG